MKRTFGPYQGTTISDFDVFNESQTLAVKEVASYLSNMDTVRETGRGLTILGPNGVGKTLLASIVLNAAEYHGYRIEAIELPTYVSLWKDQFALAQMLKVDGDDETLDEYIRVRSHIRYIQGVTKKSADWVLFDDVGREFPSESGWNQMEVFDTIRGRWNRQRPTLITTNLSKDELTQRYTEGLTSLLMESSQIIVLEGDDYRCRKAN